MDLQVDGRELRGEFLRSAKLVNTMIEQLSVFTSEVTRVAREVGTEGKLGGQAHVKGVSGVWKELTDSVNQMAGNLTAQVRNIADVTIAVATGDLSKKVTVDVRGEILQLKEATNTMVDQLRSFASEVTRVAREVGTDGRLGGQAVVPGVAGTWNDLTDSVNAMATNLTAQVRNIATVTTAVARGDLSRKITVDVKGEILELKETINTMVDQLNGFSSEVTRVAREVGTEGKLGGQAQVPGVAGTWKDLTDSVNSMASNLTDQVRNIADVATAIAKGDLSSKITVEVKGEILGAVFNTIEATMLTEGLLTQSQQLTVELQSRQSELQQTNEELGNKAKLLAEQNAEVERKNAEVEHARRALEEKAAELTLTSKYTSEFLANMSHELRTPLNSILILSQHLTENSVGNLSDKQVEFSRNINSSGSDLLHLINDILDLSKIESGTVTVDVEDILFTDLRDIIDRNFRHVAESKHLPFHVRFAEDLPRSMDSDPKRLQQILKNLLSNAVKFTSQGQVEVHVTSVLRSTDGVWITRCSALAPRSSPSPSRTPVSALRPRNRGSSLRLSSRRMPAPPANTEAQAWVSPSAANSQYCWAVKSASTAFTGREVLSLCSCRCITPVPTSRKPADQQPRCRASTSRRLCGWNMLRMISTPSRRATPCCSSLRTTRITGGFCSAWPGTEASIQGPGREQRRSWPFARPAVPSGSHLSRYRPAGHAGLDGPPSTEARLGNQAYPSANRQH